MEKLVLTGAAGKLGSYLREPLSKMCDVLITTDIVKNIENVAINETYAQADLANMAEIEPLLEGADMVVHFGALVHWCIGALVHWWMKLHLSKYLAPILLVPIISGKLLIAISCAGWSMLHLFTRWVCIPKLRRLILMYRIVRIRFIGLAKCFAEDLGRMYWEKRGLASVCMRILSCAQVTNPRAVGSWLSYDDLVRLRSTRDRYPHNRLFHCLWCL